MAGSRLEKLGTIFGRVSGLLHGGALKRENKPVWYDVYQVFPPKIDPSWDAIRPMPEIKEIFYPEDTIRANFHKKMHKRLPAESLLTTTTTDITRRAIELTQNALQENDSLTENEAIDQTIEILKREGSVSIRRSRSRKARITQTESQFMSGQDTSAEQDENIVIQASTTSKTSEKLLDKTNVRSLVDDYEEAIKEISDKNVDISKISKDRS